MWDKLYPYAREMGISLPPGLTEPFAAYYARLVEENKRVNLTRITNPLEALVKHFLDSLKLLAWSSRPEGAMLDVGSGAGFPGLPLKIASPQTALTLLDSSEKRVTFLNETANMLQLTDVTVLHGRAEDYGRKDEYREQFPLVVSRAVARLNVLVELCLPFVRTGGHFVAYKGPEGIEESRDAAYALQELNSSVVTVIPYSLPAEMGERTLLVVRKNGPIPQKYPRKAGIPGKRPL
ncbi:MAG: 16S rRNA (guanine(527)-N(7))-methyltransferase RsmG [Bacillota bacterium]|nr:16S rRNA (guanine(527)-N(7))-methyltransferase RsmG [Bacillota bacterium]MDW7684288.1 16S rRNA (guanine(527)-N(7))-methyltransferase RsmG [Bacillota bacterium]